MSAINDGCPAFPHPDYLAAGWHGMSLRDYFAAKALAAYISLDGTPCEEPDELWDEQTAQRCYAMADAMLKAREVQSSTARLIAAAPELLESLTFAIRFFDQLTPADVERMRKVLEKAGGAA